MIVTGARCGPHRTRRECAWSHSSSIVRRRLQSQGDLIDRHDDMLLGRHHDDIKFLLCGIVACGFANAWSCMPLPRWDTTRWCCKPCKFTHQLLRSDPRCRYNIIFHTQNRRTLAETLFFTYKHVANPAGFPGRVSLGFRGFPGVSWGFRGHPEGTSEPHGCENT